MGSKALVFVDTDTESTDCDPTGGSVDNSLASSCASCACHSVSLPKTFPAVLGDVANWNAVLGRSKSSYLVTVYLVTTYA